MSPSLSPSVAASPHAFDLVVIGGGVNGTGIARDAAGRGLSVLLCEQHDLAAHTSSASTKLIHGGLRYLEDYHFALVRKALLEREVLLASAPHIMWPLRFVLPHEAHLRPAWMIRAGLFLYDHLAPRRRLPGSQAIDLRSHPAGRPLASRYRRGFVYSDGWVDDARLVVLNALDASERGARILTRTQCTGLERRGSSWRVELTRPDGRVSEVEARALVNATGPWVDRFLQAETPVRSAHQVRLVKGSHIVVAKLFEHEYAYIFQASDRRIVFAIPYEREFTLIGTTDLEYRGDPAQVHIVAREIDYLCSLASHYFSQTVRPSDVCATYSGVRPLLQDESVDAAHVTRDYALELDRGAAPLLTVFGGKITTYRKLAEDAVDRLATLLGNRAARWTHTATLPGGDLPNGDFAVFLDEVRRRYAPLPGALLERCARAYGTRIDRVLGAAPSPAGLGAEVLPGLFEREINYLVRTEWAVTAEDILWRRSKLGLHLPASAAEQLTAWLARSVAAAS
ncbi:MAG: glycerol-3-phosphate dehydrogenase [Steroidobacteraceae bacterium]